MVQHKRIQVVDEDGQFLGLADSATAAIQKKQIRLISRVMLQNDKRQYLLQKRAANMWAWPGCWDNSAAGHVDEGETAEAAAYRELAEEIGVTNVKLTYVKGVYHANPPEADGSINRMYSHIYNGVFGGDITELTLDPAEVSEVRWFSLEEIQRLVNEQPEKVTDGIVLLFKESA